MSASLQTNSQSSYDQSFQLTNPFFENKLDINMYKHIVWDWNGTILNDRWLWVETMNQLLRERGLRQISEDEYQNDFHFPLRNYFRTLGFNFQKEPFDKLAMEFMMCYRNRWKECELHVNTKNLLQVVDKHGLTQSVLSAIQHELLQDMIDFYKLGSFFSEQLGIDDHLMTSKLENGRLQMEQLALKQTEVLFVGDTQHDFEVATAMGVQCMLIAHGHNSREKLQTTGAEVVVSMYDLQEELVSKGI